MAGKAALCPVQRTGRSQLFFASNMSRYISSTTSRCSREQQNSPTGLGATTTTQEDTSRTHEGNYARTDDKVVFEYPKDDEVSPTPIVQGRGGMHFQRTLDLFSLEDKVSVVTGGARGLGLVMGQALVSSGSDLAIVDLNSQSQLCSYLLFMKDD
jgi:D-arabinitol 2-dehydrogenase